MSWHLYEYNMCTKRGRERKRESERESERERVCVCEGVCEGVCVCVTTGETIVYIKSKEF